MPYGMLPVLEIDGKPIGQSNAVARYLARQLGLAGKDEWEALQCDVLVDTLGDLKQGMSNGKLLERKHTQFSNFVNECSMLQFYNLFLNKTQR